MLAAQEMPLVGYQPQLLKRVEVGSVIKRLLGVPIERLSEWQTRREGRGRRDRVARARCGKSRALHTVVETGTGRGGGAVCEARVVTGPSPRLRRVRHAHATVFAHATEVTPLRTTRTHGKVKRRACEQTEPSLASNLFVTRPFDQGWRWCAAPREDRRPGQSPGGHYRGREEAITGPRHSLGAAGGDHPIRVACSAALPRVPGRPCHRATAARWDAVQDRSGELDSRLRLRPASATEGVGRQYLTRGPASLSTVCFSGWRRR